MPSDHPNDMKGKTQRSKSSLLTFSPSRRISKSQSESGLASLRACEPKSKSFAFLGRVSFPRFLIILSISSCLPVIIKSLSRCKFTKKKENCARLIKALPQKVNRKTMLIKQKIKSIIRNILIFALRNFIKKG